MRVTRQDKLFRETLCIQILIAGHGSCARMVVESISKSLHLQGGPEEQALLLKLEEQLALEEIAHFRAGVAAVHSR